MCQKPNWGPLGVSRPLVSLIGFAPELSDPPSFPFSEGKQGGQPSILGATQRGGGPWWMFPGFVKQSGGLCRVPALSVARAGSCEYLRSNSHHRRHLWFIWVQTYQYPEWLKLDGITEAGHMIPQGMLETESRPESMIPKQLTSLC